MARIKIESKDMDGNEVEVYAVTPKNTDWEKAKLESARVFAKAVNNGAILRDKLTDVMREQGLWDDNKEKKALALAEKIREGRLKIKTGGFELDEAKVLALQIADWRSEQDNLLASTRSLDNFTAEGQSDTTSFDTIVSRCIVDEEGNRVFKNIDEYKASAGQPWAYEAAEALSELAFGLDKNWEKKLVENEFLLEYGFVDEDLRLIDEDGDFISRDGKKVDKDGRYLNSEGEFVDVDGNRVDDDGNPIVQFSPFTKNGESVTK